MNKMIAFLMVGALACVATPSFAQDEGFYATVGYAGFDTTLELAASDEQAMVAVGYQFDERLSLDLSAPVSPFNSHISQMGFGTLIEAKARPYTLALNYALRPNTRFNPFVGVGYSRIEVDPKAVGALTGIPLNAKATNGLVLRLGADYNISDQLFVRGDVSHISSDLTIYTQGGKIVDESMDPVVYSLGMGWRF